MAQPEKTFRIGHCSASVFVNTGKERERSFRSVVIQRSYKDDSDEWKTSSSFGLADLPAAIHVLRLAFDHVAQHEAEVSGK